MSSSKPTPAKAAKPATSGRGKYIKAIHTKVTQLGLDDATYRALLQARTGKSSCKDMTLTELGAISHYLSEQGAVKPGSAPRQPAANVAQGHAALRARVDSLLLQIGPADADKYVNSICQRNGWCSHINFADAHILHKLVGALSRTLYGRATATPRASRAAHTR